MHHRQDVRLAGTAADRAFGQVDSVGAAFDGGQVLRDADSGGIMGVKPQNSIFRYHFAGSLEGLIYLLGIGCTGSILEAD